MKYPDVIYATEKIGSNGIRCLDYKNKDDDVKYVRADLVKLQNTSSNSDCAKCSCGSTTDTDVYCQECLTKIAEHGN